MSTGDQEPQFIPRIDLIRDAQLEVFLSNPVGEPLTWAPSPLKFQAEISEQQHEVDVVLPKYFSKRHAPRWASPELRSFMFDTYNARRVRRNELNQVNYLCRAKTDLDDINVIELGMIHRGETGHASPAELMHIQARLGIPTVALGSLTHPWGDPERMQLLNNQRASINEAIGMHGGTFLRKRARYEVLTSDSLPRPQETRFLFMSREIDLARTYKDTEIIERSTFALDLERLDSHVAEVVRGIKFGEDWADLVRGAAKLDTIVPSLLDANEYQIAIPSSTTTISRNRSMEELYLTEENLDRRQIALVQRALLNTVSLI